MRYLLPFLTTILLLFCIVNKNPVEPIEKISVLLPLKIGNEWIYSVSDAGSRVRETSWEVKQVINIDSLEYYLIKDDSSGLSYITNNQDSGLFFSFLDSGLTYKYPIFYKYPTFDGEKYNYRIPQTDSILNLEVIKKELFLNDISYSCYGYFLHNLHSYFPIIYFSPDIGMINYKLVLYTSHGVDTSHYILYELKSYSLN